MKETGNPVVIYIYIYIYIYISVDQEIGLMNPNIAWSFKGDRQVGIC
jgi:hypothetical protein